MDFTKLKTNLEQNDFEVLCFENAIEAKNYVLSIIEKGATIGMGGSMTVVDMELPKALQESGHTIYARGYIDNMEPRDIRLAANTSDYYLCSTNAITQDGTMVNIDGICNRISAMCYGPKHIIYLVGKNKVTSDVPSAIKRIKEVACHKNGKRLNKSTPCAITGKCNDCNSPDRMCRNILITQRAPREAKYTVILINEDLGY